jgi:DNA phosphorothioation-dependent restriction protein DptH
LKLKLLRQRLLEYLASELSNAIGDSLSKTLRVFFSGPPREVLEELFNELTANGIRGLSINVAGEALDIPIFLLDSNAQDPIDVPKAARCTDSYFVQATRNNRQLPVCLALHDCVSSTLSVDSTVTRLGISHETTELDEWITAPLIEGLIESSLSNVFGESERTTAKLAVHHALELAWIADERHRDKRTAWRILEKLCRLEKSELAPHICLSALLGLPNCDPKELGSKDQISTLNRVVEFFESSGLRTGFAELESIADDELRPALAALNEHFERLGIITADGFSANPIAIYSPFSSDEQTIEDWWQCLTIEAWSRLLGSSIDSESGGKISVILENTLAAVPRGMPSIVESEVHLAINLEGSESEVSVSISRASGNAAWREIDRRIVEKDQSFRFVDSAIPQHERFIRYKVEADGCAPITLKVIVLDTYVMGVVAFCRGAQKANLFKLNAKARDEQNKKIERFESDMHLRGVGSHQLEIFTGSHLRLSKSLVGAEVDAEHSDPVECLINCIDNNHSVCLIETDEQSYFDFVGTNSATGVESIYRIYVTAEEVATSEAASEFDRLVLSHRASAKREHSNARVETITSRIGNLEEWILEDKNSFHPIILGPDYLDCWRRPNWTGDSLLTSLPMLVDPRPQTGTINAPQSFLDARSHLLDFFAPEAGEPTPVMGSIRLSEFMRKDGFETAVIQFLSHYRSWLNSSYDEAAWTDVIAVHDRQSGANALESIPYAILLTPYHPIRLAWQCRAQEVLQSAINKNARCPAASMLTPNCFPDCLMLPCRTATGSVERKAFVAMTTNSDYWSVLWSIDEIGKLGSAVGEHIFGGELGVSVDGLANGFSAQQVVRALDEVSRLMSGRSTLKIGVSCDTPGVGSCNEGIDIWCSSNLGPEHDYWNASGARSLLVTDLRPAELQPEQAVLASLNARTNAAVRWFTSTSSESSDSRDKDDLAIIAHLGTMNHQFARQGIKSAVDQSAIARWRVRKQLPAQNATFVAESRIGEVPACLDDQSLAGGMLECVDFLERQCRDTMDSYVFAPNMAVLRNVVGHSRYTAVSSSNVDAACFFGPTDKAYMWDYEMPAYSRRAGENCGYFLLAKESPSMLLSVRKALNLIGNCDLIHDSALSSLLVEISRRGMPTLKRLTTGGTMSLGEIGVLVALRFLQAEFEEDNSRPSLLPVSVPGQVLTLVVPADPFKNQFEDLRIALESKYAERPDLLVLSIVFTSGVPTHLKVTSVEVKARGGAMSASERQEALQQASGFSALLLDIMKKGGDIELWSIGWRSLLATLLDYGFRVYGQLDHYMQFEEWARQHAATLRALTNDELNTEIDLQGRLIVIDSTNSSSALDVDGDKYQETIVISHKDAFSLLTNGSGEFMDGVRSLLGEWNLVPDSKSTKDSTATSTPSGPVKPTGVGPELGRAKPKVEEKAAKGAPPPIPVNMMDESNANLPVRALEGANGSIASESDQGNIVTDQGMRFSVGRTIREFTREELFFHPSNTSLNQLNVGVIGDLGTGKTQLVQAFIYQLRSNPHLNRGKQPNILIFDYKKDYCKPSFVQATGARVISPFDMPLNLFDVRDFPQHRNAWLERAKFFTDILDKIYSGIGPTQRQRIKIAVREAFEARVGDGSPSIADVFDAYRRARGDSIDSPYSIMSDIIDGGYFVSDHSKVVPFSGFVQGVTVLDLAEVGQDDRTKNMLVVVFLNLFYEHMLRIEKKTFIGSNPKLRFIDSMLLVDEANNIMQYEFDVLKKILLQGREFGVGVLLASQYLSHFKTAHENYLEPLLTWFVHKVPSITVRDLEGIGLSSVSTDIVDAIKSLDCHECLYKTLGVDGRIIRGTPFFELV